MSAMKDLFTGMSDQDQNIALAVVSADLTREDKNAWYYRVVLTDGTVTSLTVPKQ